MKKSDSHNTLTKVHQPAIAEESRLTNTLPPHCKPYPLPRKELKKTVSSPSFQIRETFYDRPRPKLRSVHQDIPIPLPRKNSAVKQAQTCTPVHREDDDHEYTEMQPLANFQAMHEVIAPTSPHKKGNTHHSLPLMLEELAQRPHNLPATIETIDGYLGFGNQFTISTGDQLCVHLVKHTKMVAMCDNVGTVFHVPLSSAIKFGLCQDTVEYLKVSDIMKQRQSAPHVICCQQYIPGGDKHGAIEEGDVLIVKQLGLKTGLTCHSLKMDKEILLQKNYKGSFTTAPEKTSMYLLDLVEHLASLFPFKVCLYPPFEETSKNHDLFTCGRIFTMKECTTVTSLVVSNVNSINSELFDIILDDDLSKVRVSILNTAPETVAKQTVNSFPPGHYTTLIRSDFTSRFQQSLYTTLRARQVTKDVAKTHSSTTDSGNSDEEYDYIEIHPRKYYNSDDKTLSAEENREYLKSLSMHEVRPTSYIVCYSVYFLIIDISFAVFYEYEGV